MGEPAGVQVPIRGFPPEAAADYACVGAEWTAGVLIGDMEIDFPEVAASIALAEIYEGVPFPPEQVATVSGA